MQREGGDSGLRLAELVSALSLATDLGLGQPMEHVLRSCRLALALGERMGLDEEGRAVAYYVALLAWVGCTADSSELSRWFGDDIAFRAATYDVELAGLPALAFMLRHAGAGSAPLRRMRLASALLVTGGRALENVMMAHCQVTALLAERLGLGKQVRDALAQNFTRFDGKGVPPGVGGSDIALPMRIVHVAEIAEVHHRSGGVESAIAVVQRRRGGALDPVVVDELCRSAPEVFAGLDEPTSWDAVIDSEPALRPRLTEAQLDDALEAVADFNDLKSKYLAGHSRGVADLATAAARRAGLRDDEVVALRRAALLHDLGRSGVPNTIWDKPGALTDAEWERARLHAYYTERTLARPPALARLAALAALHHERLDGSGYHRGLPGASLGLPARILAAADAYHAMTEPRPHRPARSREEAARELRVDVRAGRLDAGAVDAVLTAAGHDVGRRRAGPAGLTPREVEVLVHLARGASNREIARSLHLAQKTVGNHVEHIFVKLGVTSRTAAALFAMQHGLLETL